MIVYYEVENIKSETIFNNFNDALDRIGVPLTDCKVQCNDEASNMVGAITGVVTRINKIGLHVCLTHCNGHAF